MLDLKKKHFIIKLVTFLAITSIFAPVTYAGIAASAPVQPLPVVVSEGLKRLEGYYPVESLNNSITRIKNTQGADSLDVKLGIFAVVLDFVKDKAKIASQTTNETILQQAEQFATTLTGDQFDSIYKTLALEVKKKNASVEQIFQDALKGIDEFNKQTQPQSPSSCSSQNF